MIDHTRNKYLEQRHVQQRLIFAALFVFICFGLLFIRFVWLQVFHYEQFSARANTNYLDVQPIAPARGIIADRNGVVLAYNASTYAVEITPSKASDLNATIDQIAEIVPITQRDRRRFQREYDSSGRKYDSYLLRAHLTPEQVARLSAQLYRLPGVGISAQFIREYPLHETASHVLGYIHSITDKDITALIDRDEIANYRGTSKIGRAGVEASYESELHGVTGVEEVEVTATRRPLRQLREETALPGATLTLTIDIRLQRLVETLYGDRRGAFVAIDPRNGEVLALVSKATYDPNQFIEGFDQQSWDALNDELNCPLFHRAIGGAYSIGSTYKPFMALAGMQTGTRKPEDIIMDRGIFELGGRIWRSPAGEVGGPTNATRAIIVSSNVYFYSLAYEMGGGAIHDFMKPWGFGQLTGIDLKGEVAGILPTPEWKRAQPNYRTATEKRWYDGDTVNLGIGQGHNNFTMLQLANAVATLANDGIKHRPHVLLEARDVVTGQRMPFANDQIEQMDVKPEYLQLVRAAMTEVPRKGTARKAFNGAAYASAGKTGTAQASSIPQGRRYNARELAEYKRDHALYIAFAPAENPTIAIAMIVENGGFASRSAVPIARRALDYHLLGIYPSEADIKALQRGYDGPPTGAARLAQDYDIISADELIPLSSVEVNISEVSDWAQSNRNKNPQARDAATDGDPSSHNAPPFEPREMLQ